MCLHDLEQQRQMKLDTPKTRPKFSLTYYADLHRKDPVMAGILEKTDHKILAAWAIDCAERVLPFFEDQYPQDPRPRDALVALQAWIDTGVFSMAVIRKASLASHAAAREVGDDNPARSAARGAGQAVATAHVRTHAIGAAIYALQALSRATDAAHVEATIAGELDWQHRQLLLLIEAQDVPAQHPVVSNPDVSPSSPAGTLP
jgi:hypothetical protein